MPMRLVLGTYQTTLRSRTRTRSFCVRTWCRQITSISSQYVMAMVNMGKRYPIMLSKNSLFYLGKSLDQLRWVISKIKFWAVLGTASWSAIRNLKSRHLLIATWGKNKPSFLFIRYSGTTCTAVYLYGNRILIANAGDSRSLLVSIRDKND